MIKKEIKTVISFLILFFVISISVNSLFFSTVVVEGSSMNPTLTNGDILLVDRLSVVTGIDRGDIIVCDYPEQSQVHGSYCIKRVIGIGGDTVSIKDGKLYLNGIDITEKYYPETIIEGEYPATKVPEHSYFVMGDNINVSYDSRDVGMIKQSAVLGTTEIKFN